MKKILLTLITTFSALCLFSCSDDDDDDTASEYVETSSADYNAPLSLNGHDYVDFNLPSGTLWATMNVGATTIYDCGNYFAWGETTTKTSYTSSEYTYYDSDNGTYIKYAPDSLTTLDLEDDAARQIWGDDWRTPTIDEINELKEYCTLIHTDNHDATGQAGLLITNNGYAIFLPAAGYCINSSLTNSGSYGLYWSASLYTADDTYAQCLYFSPTYNTIHYFGRSYGFPVRPVRSATTD